MKIKLVSPESVRAAVERLQWTKEELEDAPFGLPTKTILKWLDEAILELTDETVQGG